MMEDIHFLSKSGKPIIHGFHDLVGKKVKISLHQNTISIAPCRDPQDMSAIYFTEDVLRKKVVMELLEQYQVYDCLFIYVNGSYLQMRKS